MEMNLLKAISDEDKKIIDAYRKCYAADNDYSFLPDSAMCNTDYYLRFWEEAKAPLYALFGHQVMISKEVSFTPRFQDLKDTASNSPAYEPFWDFMQNFRNEIRTLVNNDQIIGASYFSYDLPAYLLNDVPLYTNHTNSLIEFDYIDPNSKEKKHFIANANSKTSKIIGKICNIFGIEGYESFRLLHSQLLNTSKLKGELVLSIHPMDYMTMSDNSCDWTSCMSWAENGCYRMGTIEMMNSPNVIVAYLKAKGSMRFYDSEWNSKKWRSLFIVTPEIITNIKGYPYALPSLEKDIVEMLKELAEKNYSWQYNKITDIKDCGVQYYFNTDKMYNDIDNDSSVKRYCAIGKSAGKTINVYYSGRDMCAWCGGTSFRRYDEEIEGSLLCDDCAPAKAFAHCDCCDDDIYEDDEYYIVDDTYLCPSCYKRYVAYDPIDEEDHFTDCMTQIFILPPEARQLSEKDFADLFADPQALSSFYTGWKDELREEEVNKWLHTVEGEGSPLHTIKITNEYNGWSHWEYYVFSDQFTEFGKNYMKDPVNIFNEQAGTFYCIDPEFYLDKRYTSDGMIALIQLLKASAQIQATS